MPDFYTISSVRSDLSRYKKNNSYSNCYSDLCSFFQNKSIEDIFNQPQVLYENGNFRYLKSRLDNSNNGKGKSCGYRLYYYVDREKESVTLLGFYPKVGKYGKPDISKAEEKKMILDYREELRTNSLVEHSIKNNFLEVSNV